MTQPINVFMCDLQAAQKLEKIFPKETTLFGGPKVRIFQGREWFIALPDDDELGPEYKGEKFDLIFMTANSLKKYYHHGYKLDLNTILKKYGKESTKVIVLRCGACSDCNDFVENKYKDLHCDFVRGSSYSTEAFAEVLQKYFEGYIPVD